MAVTLKISKNPAIIGDKITLTAEGDGDYTNFEFKRDTTSLKSGPTSTFDIESIKSTDAGSYTVIATLSDENTETSKAVNLVVNKKTITSASVVLTPASISVQKGTANTKFTATVSGAPAGTSIAYAWKKGGVAVAGNTTNTYNVDTGTVGSQTIEVSAAISGADYNTATVTKTGAVTINKIPMTPPAVELYPNPAVVTIGTPLTIKAEASVTTPGATLSYVWKKDDTVVADQTSNTFVIDTTEVYSGTITCEVTAKATDYIDAKTSKSVQVTVEIPDISSAPNYIHPLPWRETAYLWIGWWVMDEIQKAKDLGLDWKTEFDKLNYSKDLETLAIMFDNYEHVNVQESRNGYILDKPAIEAGYIY